jgi:hypothetical protein
MFAASVELASALESTATPDVVLTVVGKMIAKLMVAAEAASFLAFSVSINV